MSQAQVEEIIKNNIKKFIPKIKYYIITKDGRVYKLFNYRRVILSGKVNPNDAYVYANVEKTPTIVDFHYPSNYFWLAPLDAYLSKQGFKRGDSIFPLPNLKYIANVILYERYISIEILDVDIVAENINLSKIVSENKDYDEIYRVYKAQKFFTECGYEKRNTLIAYLDCLKLLSQGDPHIIALYNSVFQPYTVCYHMEDWKKVDCWTLTPSPS